jgi:hypothetical protein
MSRRFAWFDINDANMPNKNNQVFGIARSQISTAKKKPATMRLAFWYMPAYFKVQVAEGFTKRVCV